MIHYKESEVGLNRQKRRLKVALKLSANFFKENCPPCHCFHLEFKRTLDGKYEAGQIEEKNFFNRTKHEGSSAQAMLNVEIGRAHRQTNDQNEGTKPQSGVEPNRCSKQRSC